MPVVNLRKRVSPTGMPGRGQQQVNGFYVHSSPPKGHFRLLADVEDVSTFYVHTCPPRVLQMNPSVIRQWLRGGEVDQLEQVVLEGQGHKLIGEYAPDPKVRAFLKQVPDYMTRISELNDAVNRGSLRELQKLAPSDDESVMKNVMLCKDHAGVGLLHKAVYNDHPEIVKWIVKKYPQTLSLKDRDGKTALHYCGVCGDPDGMWNTLVQAGADVSLMDARGRTAAHYMERPGEIQLPEPKLPSPGLKRFTSGKNGLVVKPSNIRIWIHDRDIGRLKQVLWEGHGAKLRVETSNNPRVKKFLDAVPYMMNAIKEVHSAVINNDMATFLKKTSDPNPVEILNSKDVNGLTPLHKASGLGHFEITKNIVERMPKTVLAMDNEGRTALHYAKDDRIKQFLINSGADEMVFDQNGRLPSYYRANPKDVPMKLLEVVPEAPRTSLTFPPVWDWSVLNLTDSVSISAFEPRSLNKTSMDSNGVDIWQNGHSDEESQQIAAVLAKNKVAEADTQRKHVEERKRLEVDTERKLVEERRKVEVETERKRDEERKKLEEERVKREAEVKRKQAEEEKKRRLEAEEKQRREAEEKKREAELKKRREEPSKLMVEKQPVFDDRALAEERQRMLDEGMILPPDLGDENDGDPEVTEMVRAGDLDVLANLVLNGEGHRLLGQKSRNPDVQNFLENVPVYMSKIQAVHKAAREGELRTMQAALDRRRFAVAKDTPLKVTPLHVATLFGKTPIIKYLGGRFPECLKATDRDGRTALHYAACIPDNGHYFNLLLNLGADRNVKDNLGRTADYYAENPKTLTQDQLLKELSAPSQIAREILSDKEFPLFGTEEGKYLADALGEPLTQGLTEIAARRPIDPIAHLAQFLHDFSSRGKEVVGSAKREPTIRAAALPVVENDAPARIQRSHANSPKPGTSRDSDEDPVANQAATNRDEYGQSILHFAAARAQGRNGLFQLIHESGVNIGYRDELYRTARDIAVQANIPANVREIDKYVLSLAARGETERLIELLLEGYDHLLDIEDDQEQNIIDIVSGRQQNRTLAFLRSIPAFEEKRERLHRAIRAGDNALVEQMMTESEGAGRLLAIGKSTTSRCSLHVAVLCQRPLCVEFIARRFPETLRLGDNLERTALHYVMAMDDVEKTGAILVKCGAERVAKDLKGRQPSYYFMNKSEILRLQEEEQLLQL